MLENTSNNAETTPNNLSPNNPHQVDSLIDIAESKFEEAKVYAAEKLVDAKGKAAELTDIAEAKFEEAKVYAAEKLVDAKEKTAKLTAVAEIKLEEAKIYAAEKLVDAKEKAAELTAVAETKLEEAKESAKGLWDTITSAFNTKKDEVK